MNPPETGKRCRGCAYRLQGLTEHRCPECGRPFDPSDRTTFHTRLASGKLFLALSVACGLASAVGPALAWLDDTGIFSISNTPLGSAVVVLVGSLLAGGGGGTIVMIKACADVLKQRRHEPQDRVFHWAAIVVSSATAVAWAVAWGWPIFF